MTRRGEWRYATTVCGGVYVIMAGTFMMLEWSAGNWVWTQVNNVVMMLCITVYLNTDTVQAYANAYFGEGLEPFLLSYVTCGSSTNLSSLSSCSTGYGTFLNSLGIHQCKRGEEAGVRCGGNDDH